MSIKLTDFKPLQDKINQLELENKELMEALEECKDYFDMMKGLNHVASRSAREKVSLVIKKYSK